MAISGQLNRRRQKNARALAAFGVAVSAHGNGLHKSMREGGSISLFTVGYERRSGEELIAILLDAGIEYLADVRDNPISRKPDFRAGALKALCEEAGIEYGAWSDLGSTEHQRAKLRDSGDLDSFHRQFRAYAKRNLMHTIGRLARIAREKRVALMCYERAHEECHRSTVSDLLADRLNASITAIM